MYIQCTSYKWFIRQFTISISIHMTVSILFTTDVFRNHKHIIIEPLFFIDRYLCFRTSKFVWIYIYIFKCVHRNILSLNPEWLKNNYKSYNKNYFLYPILDCVEILINTPMFKFPLDWPWLNLKSPYSFFPLFSSKKKLLEVVNMSFIRGIITVIDRHIDVLFFHF